MGHNRPEREQEVKNKFEFVVFGGEYGVLPASLAAVDTMVFGGTTTMAWLKDELGDFGVKVATAMVEADIDPTSEPIYGDRMIFNNWHEIGGVKIPLPNKVVPYIAARKRSGATVTRITDEIDQINVRDVEPRFRAVNNAASGMGYKYGFPNFHARVE